MKMLNTITAAVSRSKCRFLNLFVLVFIIVSTVLVPGGPAERTLELCFYIVMILAPYFVSKNRRVGQITLIAGAVFLVPHAVTVFGGEALLRSVRLAMAADVFSVVLIAFELLLTAVVMKYSLTSRQPEEPVFGCLLTYLLIGILFGNIFMLVSQHYPGAFAENGAAFNPTVTAMRYFSFITLTTCGYGDIVPVLPPARMLAAIEAACGVLYVGLFIGRMASLSGIGLPQSKKRSEE